MQTNISLATGAETTRTLGMRASATPYRKEIEQLLDKGSSVVIDFSGKDATQSFIDELVGSLILQKGLSVTSKISFRNCPNNVKSIIKFVINDRASQINENKQLA